MTTKHYFGTDGIRGRVGGALINPELILKFGWALGNILSRQGRSKVLIGKDTRISGYMLESALEAGLSAAGVDSYLLGPMPTPGVAYLTRTFRAQAGIVISASHNSFHDNGLKIFTQQGLKISDEMECDIEKMMAEPLEVVESSQLGKAHRIKDAVGRYIEFCKSNIPSRLRLFGKKIVVDCANGATYNIAPNVFTELGAEVIEVGTNPTGLNINAGCGSTNTKTLKECVIAEKADLGIALDGDGDRVVMIDHNGKELDGDDLLYIITKDCVTYDRMQGGVIGTVMTNLGVEHAIKKLGVDFKRCAVGDRNVMHALREEGWFLGGESSGHIMDLSMTTTGDGIISALQVLRAMVNSGRKLYDLKKDVEKYPQVMINIPIQAKVILEKETKIMEALAQAEKLLGEYGQVLLRTSGTEPLIRLMVQGQDNDIIQNIASELSAFIKEHIVQCKPTN